jgi:hypothetical protein
MPLNKLAPWGPIKTPSLPPAGLAKAVNTQLGALGAQTAVPDSVDKVTAAITATDTRANLTDLASALGPLRALRDIELLLSQGLPVKLKLDEERNHELHCIAHALEPLQQIAEDVHRLRTLADKWAGGGKPPTARKSRNVASS